MTLSFIFKTVTGKTPKQLSQDGSLDWFNAYANGDDAGKGILVADWNEFPRPGAHEFNWGVKGRRFQAILEEMGYKLEWSDQTGRCEDCNGCIQESASYYGDSAHYAIIGECSQVCEKCIRNNSTVEYLEGLEDNARTAVNIRGIDPAKHGYKRIVGDYETGHHPGQTDDPNVILADLAKRGYTGIVFTIDSSGQFDIRWSVYAKGLPTMINWQTVLSEVYA